MFCSGSFEVAYTCETTTQNTIDNISITPENSLKPLSWQMATLKKAVVLSGFKHRKCVWFGFGLDINGIVPFIFLCSFLLLLHIIILTSSHIAEYIHRLSWRWWWVRFCCVKLPQSDCIPLLLDMRALSHVGPCMKESALLMYLGRLCRPSC